MPQPQLSLCIIVKDESAMLPDFLASVAGLWDELIAVDTGSIDGTRELLAQAGAKVYDFTWRDDFADARNASLKPAAGRWILFLDADERVGPEFHLELKHLVADAGAGAATLRLRNALPDGSCREADLLRLFRNDPDIRFRHPIHEDVTDDVAAFLDRTGLALRRLESPVEHLGYVREVAASRNKKDRDLNLLTRMVQEDPTDLYGWFKILEVARFWEDRDLWGTTATRAVPWFEMAEPESLARSRWSGELAVLLAQGLELGPAEGLAWLEDHADRTARSAAWCMRRGIWFESTGQTAEAEQAYRACLASEPDRTGPLHSLRPQLGLCRLAASRGRFTEAWDLAADAVNLAPADPEALMALIGFGNLAERRAESVRILLRIVSEKPELNAPMAESLLGLGETETALEVLAPKLGYDPDLALGAVVCALACGREISLDLDLEQHVADELLKRWTRKLWAGADPVLKKEFAERAGVIAGAFPWLEDFLVQIDEVAGQAV